MNNLNILNNIRPHILLLTIMATLLLFMTGCTTGKRTYVIGISQCSEDSWRSKLHDELDMATYFNEGVTLRYASAHDNASLQEQQISKMIQEGVDLLIVSPQQIGELSHAIDRAYDAGIPVVLYDRKTNSEKYTAFLGADNHLIGSMLADYVAEKLGGKGNIVDIGGLKESSPAIDRRQGFRDGLKKYPGLKIVGESNGDWTEPSGERAMNEILKTYDGPIDCVFGGNDRMAVGARKALRGRSGIIFVGVDALPNEGAGMCQVRDGILTASAIYPTHGDELLQLALDILEGRKFAHENFMASSIVTADNARVLLLQHEEVVRQGNYLKRMHTRIDNTLQQINQQRILISGFILLILLGTIIIFFTIRAYRTKHRLNKVLEEKNALLAQQRDQMQQQRDQLQEQRDILQEQHDQLCEQRDQMELQRDELSLQRDKLQRLSALTPTSAEIDEEENHERSKTNAGDEDTRFYTRFMQLIERNVGNSEFSVENLSDAIGLSRAQMYRRCKQITGNSPVEILRMQRMQRAGQLLSTGDKNISEVTYACGFTSPSYFTKCFKDHYGMSPSDFVRHHHGNKHNPS